LEPDRRFGMGYLEVIREELGSKSYLKIAMVKDFGCYLINKDWIRLMVNRFAESFCGYARIQRRKIC
jgi:hypothetical protein